MDGPVEGFAIPVHRALTEPILLGGAPRAIAIVNGTVAAALGLRTRISNIRGISNFALHAVKMFYDTAESKEGVSAFNEKREPNFHKFVT